MALILASNDANATDDFDWKDITGVQYHFPNIYRTIIQSGERFIYYRGIRRKTGKKAEAQYFGHGVIGEVWKDESISVEVPKAKWQWFAAIENYQPWDPPVPAKVNGGFWEAVTGKNFWRKGVRKISDEAFDKLVAAAHVAPPTQIPTPSLPPLNSLQFSLSNTLLRRPSPQRATTQPGSSGARYSRRSKLIGDRCEEMVVEFIRNNNPGATNLVWVAKDGQTPGWDIEFTNSAGVRIRIEVKGTTMPFIESFDLTENEKIAAEKHGEGYQIVLVAECFSRTPKIQIIPNPVASGAFVFKPVQWRATLSDTTTLQSIPRGPALIDLQDMNSQEYQQNANGPDLREPVSKGLHT